MKRLVFVTAARQVWGAEESLLTIAAECSRRGIPTALVCFGGEVADRFASASDGEVYCVSAGAPPTEQKLKENAALWSLYWRHARRGDRLAIFTYYLTVPTLAMVPATKALGIRIGLDLHDNLPGSKGRALLRAVARGADAVIACSSYTARQVAGHRRIRALHGPVRDRAFRPSVPGNVLRVGVVGRITTGKRHALVMDAMSRCEGMIMVVRGAGDGTAIDNSAEIRRRGAEELGDRFVDEGRVTPDVVLDGLDVVVVANPTEPMGRTVLEAQLQGVIAVVPSTGGASELVEDGVTGFVFRAEDADDLARVLTRVKEDADRDLVVREARSSVTSGVTLPEAYTTEYLIALG